MGLLAANSRRAFLRLGGGVAALASGAVSGTAQARLLNPSWARAGENEAQALEAGRVLSFTERLAERRRDRRHQYKTRGGIDPDIAALRSISPCMKAWMQQQRDNQDDHAWGKLREKLGLWW